MPAISSNGRASRSLPFTLSQVREFRADLLGWFDAHKRDLPWRRTRDPYAIWVSEMMLQQTRVAAVLDHYAKWMQRLPTIEALAAASEDEVLTAWSGLGYYRRARFLHRAAKAVVADHNSALPRTAVELRRLPGIGAYTSAAIASIAFGEPVAVVDGNVERVLLRQAGKGEPGAGTNGHSVFKSAEIQQFASLLLDARRPGDFNQAMMELGATICLPRNPLCLSCPVQTSCRTRGEHPTAARLPSATVEIAYALIVREQRVPGKGSKRESTRPAEAVLLEQRSANASVMPGMWELPRAPEDSLADSAGGTPLLLLRHAIMQTNYRVAVIRLLPARLPASSDARSWTRIVELPNLPLTGLARKILLRLGMLDPSRGESESLFASSESPL